MDREIERGAEVLGRTRGELGELGTGLEVAKRDATGAKMKTLAELY